MQTLLIFISFILNIAALLAIVILYTRQNRLLEVEKRQEKAVREMEDIISSYLLEMKEDNERFIQQFQAVNEGNFSRSQEKVEKIKQAAEKAQNDHNHHHEAGVENKAINNHSYKRQNAVKAYSQNTVKEESIDSEKHIPPVEPSKEDTVYNQIQTLQEKGYTLDDIAKELGRGITEIELLLKFRQNKK
ncbi:hypothetical protein ACOJQI_07950 [Bacillus salacetis]|uniref:hypothetical protein n=1 Tax=Bacillus salacetis TaxID=2315464 RepID=UPI003BA12B1A